MPTFGIFAPDWTALTKRPHRLRTTALTCLIAALPLFVNAEQPAGRETAQLNVSRTDPLVLDEKIRAWFKEQDRILDEILLRLSRVENLVRELHRMIQALPVGNMPVTETAPAIPATPSAAPPVAPPPAPMASAPVAKPPVIPHPIPVPAAIAPARVAPTGVLGFFNEWGTELAGVTLLMLVLMIAARNRRAKQAAEEEWDEGEVDMLAIPAAPQAIQQPRPTNPPPVVKATTRPAAAVHRPTAPAPAPTSAAKPKAFAPPPPPPALEPELPAEPHDQSLELAEIMLSMGLGHGAAQTLTEQIRSEPKEALRHWLMLLEVYRQNGEQDEFERSAEELRLHFNVQPEDWNARPEDRPTLENYPHIAARVVELWGTPAGLTYLQNLLDDNRGGARAGFPQAVAEELLVLTHILMANGVVADELALA